MSVPVAKILSAVLPIVLYLLAGFLIGRRTPHWLAVRLSKGITPVVWVILFVIGMESGEAFSSFATGLSVIKQASAYALITSLVVFALLMPFNRKPAAASESSGGWAALLVPLRECVTAFALVLFGALAYQLGWQQLSVSPYLFNISWWLYALLWLIGVDLARLEINRSWLAPRVFLVPLAVVVGSLVGGLIISWITGERLFVSLALSSGFGWFSLSGALAGQHLGDAYGSVALINDLMRELLGLTVVFMLGRNFSSSSVGVCAATAMDTTLPFVRKSCGYDYVPTAIISGLLLTIAAPFLMLFFLSFV